MCSYQPILRMIAILCLVGSVIFAAAGRSNAASSAGQDWLDSLVQAVLAEQAKEVPLGGKFSPYLAQLTTVRGHLINGESEAVYRAMNRFMDMPRRVRRGSLLRWRTGSSTIAIS